MIWLSRTDPTPEQAHPAGLVAWQADSVYFTLAGRTRQLGYIWRKWEAPGHGHPNYTAVTLRARPGGVGSEFMHLYSSSSLSVLQDDLHRSLTQRALRPHEAEMLEGLPWMMVVARFA
jgi:hypothetical protein